ncbi:MarR family winged helix-turn-helix transcriptional regulator [Lacrimispora sp.]|uniref:MarR family winged helix-turn-helix transcriptional regulator n=1 Tax=Lacrimispora sp. TaxID=2719234 RepID=UPI00399172EC
MVLYLSKYIAGIYRQSKIEINQKFQYLGLRATEGDILLFLHDNPGLSQKKIAALMVLDPSLVGRDLQRLIEEKYVRRQSSPIDNRVNQVYLTDRGEQIVVELQQIIITWWSELLSETENVNEPVISEQLSKLYDAVVKHALQNRTITDK